MDSYRTCRSMACLLRYNGDESKYFKEEVGMAKTIAEYRKGFEDLYNEMCKEHDIKASVSVFRETAIVCPIDELSLTVVRIEID